MSTKAMSSPLTPHSNFPSDPTYLTDLHINSIPLSVLVVSVKCATL